ncbi:MAG: photosynthetic reaction center subunit H, partial [Acetobacteraceae bacterium]|nr:photosynthetic reaction center subunit H [Acetobacteraceae bacterium]
MQIGAITAYIDVAQLVLYAFWIFFAGLVLHLLQENKREGYPLVASDRYGRSPVIVEGFPPVPAKKSFLLHDGSRVFVPRDETREKLTNAVPATRAQGSPIMPTGEPLLAGIGPGAYAQRADTPDVSFDDQQPKIVPLRAAPAFFLA